MNLYIQRLFSAVSECVFLRSRLYSDKTLNAVTIPTFVVVMQFRLSAKLCALGVLRLLSFRYTFTAETQRTGDNAENRPKLHHYLLS